MEKCKCSMCGIEMPHEKMTKIDNLHICKDCYKELNRRLEIVEQYYPDELKIITKYIDVIHIDLIEEVTELMNEHQLRKDVEIMEMLKENIY